VRGFALCTALGCVHPVPLEAPPQWWTRPDPCPGRAVLWGELGDEVLCELPSGKEHGPWTTWNIDGAVIYSAMLRRGKEHGLVQHFHEVNGAVEAFGRVRHDRPYGLWVWYEEDGRIEQIAQWRRGRVVERFVFPPCGDPEQCLPPDLHPEPWPTPP
jgi:hypothetical protein